MSFPLKYALVLKVITLLAFMDKVHAAACTKSPNLDSNICWNCTLDYFGNEQCFGCTSGYFLWRGTCVACPQKCTFCNINFASNSTLWTTVSTFWDQKFQDALITQSGPSSGSTSGWLNDYQFSTMPSSYKQRWIEAYYFYKSLESEINKALTSVQFRPVLFQAYDLIQSTRQGSSYPNQWDQILQFVNTKLNLNFSLTTFSNKIDTYMGKIVAKCTQCNQYYYYDSASSLCLGCDRRCSTCTSSSICSGCEVGYFPITWYNSSKTCIVCEVTGCRQCVDSNRYKCYECNKNYYITSSGGCIPCDPSCHQCTNSTFCTNCQVIGFTATPQGQCVRCTDPKCGYCQSTNISNCVRCINFGEQPINGVCTSCSQGCSLCQSASVCMYCFQGYKLSNGSCIPDTSMCKDYDTNNASKCKKCFYAFNLNNNTGLCQLCLQNQNNCKGQNQLEFARCRPGCQTCSNIDPQKCMRCSYFYYLNAATQTCEKCKSGCKMCTDANICTMCVQNYYLNGGQCLACGEQCTSCWFNLATNAPQCPTLINGYQYGLDQFGNSAIVPCPQGCFMCLSGKCQACKSGYTLDPNYNCIKCSANCRACNYKNITQCSISYYNVPLRNDAEQIQTQLGVQRPLGCNLYANKNCISAAQGYTLVKVNGSFVAQWKCFHPCEICNGTQCTVCKVGYILNSGRCVPDLSCNPNCKYCIVGSYKDSATSTCKVCSLANCGSCPNDACKQCNQGYYLNTTTSTCVTCPPKCKICYDDKACKVCAKGYLRQLITYQNYQFMRYQCFPCADNCASCQAQRGQCTSCKDGYILNGTNCVGKYAVQFKIELNAVYTTFLSSGSVQQFTTDVATLTNMTAADITITKITQGSTIVTGAIFSSTQTSANGIQTSLQSNTGTIAGSTVLTSSYTVVTNTPPSPGPTPGPTPAPNDPSASTEVNDTPAGSKNKIAIIAGSIVGGVALITILGIGIYLYKKHKAQSVMVDQVNKNQFEEQVSSQPVKLVS